MAKLASMKKIIVAILTFVVLNLNAQMDTKSVNDPIEFPEIATFDFFYGNILYQKASNERFNSFKYSKFGNPLQTAGISLTYTIITKPNAHIASTHISYSQVIPQQLILNDSISGKINGGYLGLNLISVDLTPKSKISSILLGAGFNAGRLRISSDEYRALKNSYIAPTLYFTPRLIIKRIVISLRGEYQFDLTKKNWQPILLSKKQKGLEVDDLRQTGLILNFCLSWKF